MSELAVEAPTLEADWDTFCSIEDEIGKAEHEGIHARWRCGKMLTRYPKNRGGRSPYADALRKLSGELGISEAELRYRRLFAERYETEEEFINAVDELKSWHDVINKVLSSTAHLSSEKDEWATPQELFDALDEEFHFTLDVCASPANAKCERFLSEAGLLEHWTGVCWMNPPYSEVDAWIEKAYMSSQDGATVVCLVPARTDVAWFWDFARHGEIRLLRGRLHFVDDEGNTGPAPFPSCLVVFGAEPQVTWHEVSA